MNKECGNCKFFDAFFTKIGFSYFQTNCGRCWEAKEIVEIREFCERWEAKPSNPAQERISVMTALDNAMSQICEIKNALSK